MESNFEKVWRLGAAAFVLKAIFAAIVASGLLLAFILLRRTYRKWYFAKRDTRVYELRKRWNALISGQIPYETWRRKAFDRRIVETIALDAFEAAGPEESARLLKFLRTSGLIEKRIFEARQHTGWRKMRSLVALGRTRAPEGIPALAEGLCDGDLETRLAALRGLGRMACPQAAEEILAWVGDKGLTVPELPLQSALVQCCAERPQLLLPHVQNAEGRLREVLGRVLGEMASDPIWFVRLRAIVSLGKLADPRAIPALLRGLTDSNRLVRLRAGEALVGLKTEMVPIFEQVVAAQDHYGLYAYLTALENADLRGKLEVELQASTRVNEEMKKRLQNVLKAGTQLEEEPVTAESVPKSAAGLR